MRIAMLVLLIVGTTAMTGWGQFLGPAPGSPAIAREQADSTQLEALLKAKKPQTVIREDDRIAVDIYGLKEYEANQRVTEGGDITLPFIGEIHVGGRSASQAQVLVASKLKERGIINDPQVTVTITDEPWAVVTVSGDVGKPGIYPARGSLTVMDYISEAEGFDDSMPGVTLGHAPASATVTLIRPSIQGAITIPLGSDASASPYGRIPLFPGDELRVGKVGVVYVVGAFKSQGSFALKSDSATTVLEAIALAGGIGYEADTNDARIIRTQRGVRTVLPAKIGPIIQGRSEDLPLQANDILFIPSNKMKAAIKGGGSGVIASLASAYLYTH